MSGAGAGLDLLTQISQSGLSTSLNDVRQRCLEVVRPKTQLPEAAVWRHDGPKFGGQRGELVVSELKIAQARQQSELRGQGRELVV